MVGVKPGRWVIWLGLALFCVVILIVASSSIRNKANNPGRQDEVQPPAHLRGFSLSPKSFGVTDYSAFFETASQNGNALTWAGQYEDLAKTQGNAAKTVISQAKQKKMTPIIIIGPADGEVFDGVFAQGFSKTILDFISSNDAPYLGLGNEIDSIYRTSPARYSALVATINGLIPQIKEVSPKTKVFTTFQLERTKGLQGGLFGKANNPNDTAWTIINELKGLDLLAFTSYPCLIYKAPTEIPEEYYSDIQNHTKLPVIFTEIGWFRGTPAKDWESDDQEQTNFINTFSELTTKLDPRVVIWPFLYDQPAPAPFQVMGLLGKDQDSSLGLEAWKRFSANGTQP